MNFQQIYLEVVRKYFAHLDNIPSCRVSQGKMKDERRAIVFGTYNALSNEIRIHPILLQENTPQLALEFVLYHELLHFEDRAYLLRRKKGEGVHTKDFRIREKEFPRYKEAKSILTKLLKGEAITGGGSEAPPKKAVPRQKLRGEALATALSASLERLESVMGRYGLELSPVAMKKSRKKGQLDEQ
ncbi:MAG: hypothetical protein ACRC9L_00575 [Brevinema sp.]